jgi:hypothetical protein
MKRNRKQEIKDRIVRILLSKSEDNGATLDELFILTALSRDRLKKLIYELAVKDEIPISLNPEPPYRFSIKTQEL